MFHVKHFTGVCFPCFRAHYAHLMFHVKHFSWRFIMVHLHTRTFVRILSFLLFIIFTLFGFVFWEYRERQSNENMLSNVNRRAFFEFLSDIEGLDSSLSKLSLCSSSKQITLLSADIWNKANSAASLLSLLPLSTDSSKNTLSYLNKVASYAYFLSSSVEISDDTRSTISSLCDCSDEICASFQALGPYIREPGFFSEASSSVSSLEPVGLFGSLALLESAFPETPTLLYDGPFSEHIKTMIPLVNQEELISRKDAQIKVAELLGISFDQVKSSGDTSGDIPTFGFKISGDRNISVDITCHGGHLLCLSSDGAVLSDTISNNDAVNAADSFLSSVGYTDLQESYNYRSGGVLYINFEAVQDNVICYPDLIQVGVSLSDGQILFLNAEGYLSNHRQREISPTLTESEVLSSHANLQCDSARLAMIPTDGKNELLTWELSCLSPDSSHYLIYVNAETGQEEKILFLQESENGTLVY